MYSAYGKRAFDLALVTVTSPIWLILLVLIATGLRLAEGNPILFRQKRPGRNGDPFTLLKFRTMTESRSPDGALLVDEVRLTGIGRLIRRTSLDELPELINVLRGEMSLVGPRPLLMRYLERYTTRQARRHEVLPGITGWAQVKGRNALTWEEKFDFDVWYVDHVSFWLDLKILGMTVWKVLTGEGLSAEGHATMPEFKGTLDE
jgi:sugar transferase EpsL